MEKLSANSINFWMKIEHSSVRGSRSSIYSRCPANFPAFLNLDDQSFRSLPTQLSVSPSNKDPNGTPFYFSDVAI